MSGLEISEVYLTNIKKQGFRIESEYFAKHYLELEANIYNFDELHKYVSAIECGPFGSSLLDTEYSMEGLPFVRPLNLVDGIVNKNNFVYVSEDRAMKNGLKTYPKWTLVLSRVGVYVRFGVVSDFEKIVISSNAIAVVPKDEVVSKFLAVYLRTKYGHLQLYRNQQYSSQPKIATDFISKMKVPKIEGFYRRIADCYDTALLLLRKADDEFSKAEQMLLVELGIKGFVPSNDPISVKSFFESFKMNGRLDAEYYQPKYVDYEVALNATHVLTELCNIHDSVFMPSTGEFKYIELADIGTTGNITSCTIAPFDELPSRARRLVKRGQVIVSSIEGSLASCALVTDDYNGAICSTGFYIVDSTKINSETLLVLFKSEPIQQIMKKRCSGTILTAISKSALEAMPFPLIKEDKQREIADLIQSSFSLRSQSEQLLERATQAVEIAIEDGEEKALKFLESL